jgi:hypothetical protein
MQVKAPSISGRRFVFVNFHKINSSKPVQIYTRICDAVGGREVEVFVYQNHSAVVSPLITLHKTQKANGIPAGHLIPLSRNRIAVPLISRGALTRLRLVFSSPLSSRAQRSLPLRRHSTPSARRRLATWRLRRGSPCH